MIFKWIQAQSTDVNISEFSGSLRSLQQSAVDSNSRYVLPGSHQPYRVKHEVAHWRPAVVLNVGRQRSILINVMDQIEISRLQSLCTAQNIRSVTLQKLSAFFKNYLLTIAITIIIIHPPFRSVIIIQGHNQSKWVES